MQHRAHGEVNRGRVVSSESGSFEIDYDETVMAVAPGQSVALYDAADPDVLVGGGIISATVPARIPA